VIRSAAMPNAGNINDKIKSNASARNGSQAMELKWTCFFIIFFMSTSLFGKSFLKGYDRFQSHPIKLTELLKASSMPLKERSIF
jgi:hypothetical protein